MESTSKRSSKGSHNSKNAGNGYQQNADPSRPGIVRGSDSNAELVEIQSLFGHYESAPSIYNSLYNEGEQLANSQGINPVIPAPVYDHYYASDNQINYLNGNSPISINTREISLHESPTNLQNDTSNVSSASSSLPKRKPSVQVSNKNKSNKYNKNSIRPEHSHISTLPSNSSPGFSEDADINDFMKFANNDYVNQDFSSNDFAANNLAAYDLAPNDFNNEFINLSDTDNLSGSEITPLKFDASHRNDPKRNEKLQKKGRNPGFHLPLDNLNNRNIMFLKLTDMMSSSQDSPKMDKNYDNLRIMEPDLGFGYDNEFRLNNFLDNITPSMKPPGTNQQEYFDFYSASDTGGDDNYKGVKFDNSNEGISTENNSSHNIRQSSHTASNMSFGDRNETLPTTFNYPPENGRPNDKNPSSGSNANFDTRCKTHSPDTFVGADGLSESRKEEPMPLSKKNLFLKSQQNYGYLDVQRPIFERADSNQSINSVSSIGSGTKKKRTPKGAVCSVCDKYISRDLTRHMRIHDDVGRFHCVYPKSMCNHKTGYFNRPYDYKKHLLHMHFKFDDPKGKTAHTLTDKLPLLGSCHACGARFSANDWLDSHVLANSAQRCSYLKNDN